MYDRFADWYKQGQLTTPPVQKWKLEEFKEAIREATESVTRFKHVFVHE